MRIIFFLASASLALAQWTPAHLPDGQPDVRGYWVAKVYGMGCLTNPLTGPGCVEEDYGQSNKPSRPREKPPAASSILRITKFPTSPGRTKNNNTC